MIRIEKKHLHQNAILLFFLFFFLTIPHLGTAYYPDGFYNVSKIIDGDTFELTDGKKVRMIGIDSPDIGEDCSEQAVQRLASLILGETVYLEKDASETDSFDRLLRYVYVSGNLINLDLVNDGYAWAAIYPPDTMYASQLTDAEESARDNNRGCLWNSLPWDDSDGYLEVGCFIGILFKD